MGGRGASSGIVGGKKIGVEQLAKLPYKDWAAAAVNDNRARNQAKTVGSFDTGVMDTIRNLGGTVAGAEIKILGKDLAHAMRQCKSSRGASVPLADILNLPCIIASPKAVIYDKKNKNTIFVFAPNTGDGRLGKIVVKAKGSVNRAITAGLVSVRDLNASRYLVIKGSL